MSRIGIILCSIYALIIIVCFVFAFLAGFDFKGRFIFLELPLSAQIAIIDAIGLSSKLQNLSWVGAYIILGLPTFVVLYFIGKAMD